MLSGGLDSLLTVKTLLDLGLDVHPVHLVMPFGIPSDKPLRVEKACAGIGIKPVIISRGRAFMDMVRKPRFGYGKNMNPCIDCRIAMFKNAKRIMREVGGDFIATGEVIGQRPMSQRRDAMSLIDREADVKGLILRPLCAKNLEPSIAEINGLVDREKLYDYTGRSRKPQIALAKKLGITDYPTPAGGCEVTEPGFSARLRHLFEITEKDEVDDWNMLLVGRHIILGPKTKAIVSRNEKENKWLEKFSKDGDGILEPVNFPGPTAAITGSHNQEDVSFLAAVMLKYGKPPSDGKEGEVEYRFQGKRSIVKIKHGATQDQIAPKLVS